MPLTYHQRITLELVEIGWLVLAASDQVGVVGSSLYPRHWSM